MIQMPLKNKILVLRDHFMIQMPLKKNFSFKRSFYDSNDLLKIKFYLQQ